MRRGLTVGGTGPAIGDCEPGGGNMDTQLPVAQVGGCRVEEKAV